MAEWDSFFITSTNQELPTGLGPGNKSLFLAWKSSTTLPQWVTVRYTLTQTDGEIEVKDTNVNTSVPSFFSMQPGAGGVLRSMPGALGDGTSTLNKVEVFNFSTGAQIILTNVIGLFIPSHYSEQTFGTFGLEPVTSGTGSIPVGAYAVSFPQMLGSDLVVSVIHAWGMRNRVTPADFTPTDPNSKLVTHEFIAATNTSTTGWFMGISVMPLKADPVSPLQQHYENDWQTSNTFTRSVSKGFWLIQRDPRLWEHSEVINTGTRRLNLIGQWDGSSLQPVTPEINI